MWPSLSSCDVGTVFIFLLRDVIIQFLLRRGRIHTMVRIRWWVAVAIAAIVLLIFTIQIITVRVVVVVGLTAASVSGGRRRRILLMAMVTRLVLRHDHIHVIRGMMVF